MTVLEYVTDGEIYQRLICTHVPRAERLLWLATADLKDLHVDKNSRMVPFLEVLSDLAGRNVELRLLHAKEPGPAFQRDFDRYRRLLKGLEMMHCPRVHLKCAVIDGRVAYSGSANLTGAGVGAKNADRRNFESGFITDQPDIIRKIAEHFDGIWRGSHCRTCQRKEYCCQHQEILGKDQRTSPSVKRAGERPRP
jgi:phosphatidylserine/phosphatidylglycerophosphate/cardiolipin synthase-like enzyme